MLTELGVGGGGDNWRPLFSLPAFGFTNEQHELRGKKFFCVISESLSDFFFFCRVNPNLKDLKPTFALETESLCIFWMKRVGGNKIPQRYFLLFCIRKPPTLSVETIFVSNFSHLSTPGQVSWRKAPDPRRQWGEQEQPVGGLGSSFLQQHFANCS